jgi:DDE superfamily endonuclease
MELEGEAARLTKRPVTFKRLTGLSVEQFIKLLTEVRPLLVKAETRRLTKRERRRGIGAGEKYALPVCDRLLMTLMYYRTYISQEFLGYLFDLHASNACRNLAIMRPVLAQVFRIPERRIVMTPEEVTTLFLTAPNSASTDPKAA